MYRGFDLNGKVAALTGSTSGMGLAIARGLAECGAKIVVSSHHNEDVDRAVSALREDAHSAEDVKCDILNPDEVESFGEKAQAAFGKVDILFLLAAPPAPLGPLSSLGKGGLEDMLRVVGSDFAIIRQFLPGMKDRRDGSIVVMSSIASV